MDTEDYIIKQISVFSENKPGRLASIAKALEEEKINIFAFSIAEAKGFGVVRVLVDRPEPALKKLADIGFMVSFTDVIAVNMKDEPGGLYETARILGGAGINIEYAYAYSGKDAAVLILRVDQVKEAIKGIRENGGELLKAEMFK
ncbi:ACT domain-containing protein [Methanochimaera problematica]|uniref:ACT domain-containing protein n=1 Tax=Methanochimaera problematica TaxID=2609417 RepID=UPI0029392615|nr:ACT domain-containing protein [Methanoplanus sp. FWC-SCC4]